MAETWTAATQQIEIWDNRAVQAETWTAAGTAPAPTGAPMMRFNAASNSQLLALLEDF